MSKVFADLHVHSTASDGVLSPAELVRQSRLAGLSVIALTDHDTVKGVPMALEAAVTEGIIVVPGIELSCAWPDSDISLHVVGLFIDHTAPSLVNTLEEQQKSRYSRAFRILDKLEKLDIPVEPLRRQFLGDKLLLLGRPHIARYLLEIGVITDFQEAFDRFLKRGAPAHVAKTHLLPEAGIKLIRDAGGLAFIAHPGLTDNWDRTWHRIKGLPWDGMEVYYSEHSSGQLGYFKKLAKTQKFLISGGSDFHGEYGKHVNRLGGYGLDQEQYGVLKMAADHMREQGCPKKACNDDTFGVTAAVVDECRVAAG